MRARYYDPASGRFISEDPGQNGTNWYAYCNSNPGNAIDPTGRESTDWFIIWVANMGGWDMAAIYLCSLAIALGRVSHIMGVQGEGMKIRGQFLQASWLEARGSVLEGNGILLGVFADLLALAGVVCAIFGALDELEAAKLAGDYLTSAQSVGSLFGGGDD